MQPRIQSTSGKETDGRSSSPSTSHAGAARQVSLFKLPPPLLGSPLPAAGWSVVAGAAAGSCSYMVHIFLDFMSYPTPSYLTESIHMENVEKTVQSTVHPSALSKCDRKPLPQPRSTNVGRRPGDVMAHNCKKGKSWLKTCAFQPLNPGEILTTPPKTSPCLPSPASSTPQFPFLRTRPGKQ